MPIVEEQVTVQVEARRVWDFLADPANLPVWDAVVQRAEQLGDGALAAGTVWRGDARLLGHQFQWTNEFAEVEAPRRRCQHGRGALGCALTQTLEVTDDRHTVLTQRVEVAEGLGGLFGELSDPVVTRAYARLLRAGLENLRSLLEDDARGAAR